MTTPLNQQIDALLEEIDTKDFDLDRELETITAEQEDLMAYLHQEEMDFMTDEEFHLILLGTVMLYRLAPPLSEMMDIVSLNDIEEELWQVMEKSDPFKVERIDPYLVDLPLEILDLIECIVEDAEQSQPAYTWIAVKLLSVAKALYGQING